jgi:VWFA-related protein
MRRALPFAIVACGLTCAQPPPPPAPVPDDLPVFRTETALATVRFHVVNRKQYVVDLKPGQIELLEDGKPQRIALFEGGVTQARKMPVEIVLVFDTSGSVMQEGLLDPVTFKQELLDAIPNAWLSVYRFETRMRRLAQRTRNPEELRKAFAALDKRAPGGLVLKLDQHANEKDRKRGIGGSPIFEAAMESARDATSGPGEISRLLLIFSDGFATSGTKPQTAGRYIQDRGVPVYPVVLGHQKIVERLQRGIQQQNSDPRAPRPASRDMQRAEEQQREIEEFASLAEMTGGRAFSPRFFTQDTIRNILRFMVGQVRNEYVVGYYPATSAGGKKTHKLTVRLKSKETGKLLGGTRVVTR